MNILFLTSFFPPTHNAGTEKRTLGYAAQLLEMGHDVQVICAGDWDKGNQYWNGMREENYLGIKVRRVDLNWTLAPDANRFLYRNHLTAEGMKQWVAEIKPDLIHITSCYSLSASVIETIKELNIPMVLTLTDFWFICPKHTLLRFDETLCDGRTSNWECLDCMLSSNNSYQKMRPILKNDLAAAGIEWVSRQPSISNYRGFRGMALNMGERKAYLQDMITIPDEVIAPSAYLKEIFAASGATRDIRVIPSGHDLSWLESANHPEPSEKINIGFIGQITPIKGLHVLLDAFKTSSPMEKAKLSIYGPYERDSVYRDTIQRSINGNAESIFIRGSFPHDRLGEVLSEIDVLVVPSLWHENNPRVIQEAYAAHTPVIASNVGGMSEFVEHERNGLLFERNNEIDLARQLSRIINEPNLLQNLRDGITPVKTIESEVEELIMLYKELVR